MKNSKVHHKELKIATKNYSQKNQLRSEQNIYPIPENFTQPLIAMVVTFSMSEARAIYSISNCTTAE